MKLKPENEFHIGFEWRETSAFEKIIDRSIEILENSFLPRPDYLMVAGQKNKIIKSYADEKIKKLILKKKYLQTCTHSGQVAVVLYGNIDEGNFNIGIFYYAQNKPQEIEQIVDLFTSICQIETPCFAMAHPSKHFEYLKRAYRKYNRWRAKERVSRGLYWLNYYGPEEIRKQGGDALLDNPYAEMTPMGEGLFIRVGDNPLELQKKKNEKIFFDATAAMPEIELLPLPEDDGDWD